MPYTTAGKNKMLAALGATHVAAYSGDPSGAGEELDRKPIAWEAAAGGERDQAADVEFAIAAGKPVNHIAYFDAASGGTLLMYDDVPAETFAGAGTYTLTSSVHDLNS